MPITTAGEPSTGPALRPSNLDRVFRVFGDVRQGEAGAVLLPLFNLFLLLVVARSCRILTRRSVD